MTPKLYTHREEAISDTMKALVPLLVTVVNGDTVAYTLFNSLLSRYHYLGYRGAEGENTKHLIRDAQSLVHL